MGSQDAADLPLGQHLALLERLRLRSCEQLLLKVEHNVAQLLLDAADDCTLSSGGEGVRPVRFLMSTSVRSRVSRGPTMNTKLGLMSGKGGGVAAVVLGCDGERECEWHLNTFEYISISDGGIRAWF
jgi:hypothetical protein